jgi:putative flippase GtrA
MSTKLVTTGSKFVVVGIISTVLNYALFWFLAQILSVNYLVSSISGYLFGLICGFLINNFWTFDFGEVNLTIVLWATCYVSP